MAKAKKKVSGIKKSNPQSNTDSTVTTYGLQPGDFNWGYEVNKLTSVRKGNKAGRPLIASSDVVYKTGVEVPGKRYTAVKGFKGNSVQVPSVQRTGGLTGNFVKPGVVGPKSVLSTPASRRNLQVTRKRDEAIRRGSKNPKAGR